MEEQVKQPGFFKGLLHGVFAPLRLLIKVFVPKLKILKIEDRSAIFKVGTFVGIIAALALTDSSSQVSISKDSKKEDLEEENVKS